MKQPVTATRAWLEGLDAILQQGTFVAPRGMKTQEILQHTMEVDMRHPVVLCPTRKVSDKFLGAEAYWILSGDDTVAGIKPYNKNIAKYSDDGEKFFGAYGPKIIDQLDYVVGKLLDDPDTRQAGLNIWRENPPPTKDVPCTIAMFFNIRAGKLNMHVFMRSSDIWLGVPYDVFNFSMVAHLVCCRLNMRRSVIDGDPSERPVQPGTLYLTAASRHLYDSNRTAAVECYMNDAPWHRSVPTPRALFESEKTLMFTLDQIREGVIAAQWWHIDPET